MNWLSQPEHAQTAAFAATTVCVWASAFWCSQVARDSPRLLVALVLFALNWALLLLYYLPGAPQNEILSAYSGFVLVYVGILVLREAGGREDSGASGRHWRNRVPLLLFRSTVGGLGIHLIALRLFHRDQGYGTLALAWWGTVLSIFGYAVIWFGVRALFSGSRRRTAVAVGLGALLAGYSGCELCYAVWYTRDAWPPYARYAAMRTGSNPPDADRELPFEPRPDWPDHARWAALRSRPDWPGLKARLGLRVEPHQPEMPVWLEYAFAALKLCLTGAFLYLVGSRPRAVAENVAAPLAGPPVGRDARPRQTA